MAKHTLVAGLAWPLLVCVGSDGGKERQFFHRECTGKQGTHQGLQAILVTGDTHKHQMAPQTPEKPRLRICFLSQLQYEPLLFIAVGTTMSYLVIAPHVVFVPFGGMGTTLILKGPKKDCLEKNS